SDFVPATCDRASGRVEWSVGLAVEREVQIDIPAVRLHLHAARVAGAFRRINYCAYQDMTRGVAEHLPTLARVPGDHGIGNNAATPAGLAIRSVEIIR